jgi:phosphoserine phosphatase
MRVALAIITILFWTASALADPLPSWRNGPTKDAIVSFVETSVAPDSTSYVPPAERIATFDNDGTLWAEQPVYFQLIYVVDKAKDMLEADPDLGDAHPALKAAADGDLNALLGDGHKGLLEAVALTHSGMMTDEYKASVSSWISEARHPTHDRRYDEMVYQPMLELLSYLRANGYKTYIVSGGGIDFIRVFSEEVYGIPPEQVIGSSVQSEFVLNGETAETVKSPDIFFIDDKEGKPVAINHHIGRRPVIAVGNSDGDLQMLQYASSDGRPALGILVHHTDAGREWAYDRDGPVGKLDNALDQAEERGWTVIDMKTDWRTVFPWELEN